MLRSVIPFIIAVLLPPAALAAESGSGDSRARNREGTDEKTGPERVMVLMHAVGAEDSGRERSFVTELRMSLDDTIVIERRVKDPDFASRPVDDQVAELRPLLEKHRAAAAIWLAKSPPDLLVLHVVVVSNGRALVRLVEAPAEGTSETGLAAAARELVEASYLFNVVESKWSSLVSFRSLGGLLGYDGPSLWMGGDIGLERSLAAGLSVRFGISVFGGPIGSSNDLDVSGWALAPGLGALYLWDFGRFSLGPVLGFRSWWSNVSLKTGEGPKERSTEWQFQAFLNLELRIIVTKKFDIALGGGATATPLRDTYHRESDDELLYATPFVSWEAFIGAVFAID